MQTIQTFNTKDGLRAKVQDARHSHFVFKTSDIRWLYSSIRDPQWSVSSDATTCKLLQNISFFPWNSVTPLIRGPSANLTILLITSAKASPLREPQAFGNPRSLEKQPHHGWRNPYWQNSVLQSSVKLIRVMENRQAISSPNLWRRGINRYSDGKDRWSKQLPKEQCDTRMPMIVSCAYYLALIPPSSGCSAMNFRPLF